MLRQVGLGVLVLLALALLALNVVALSGVIVDEHEAVPPQADPAGPAPADVAPRKSGTRDEQIDRGRSRAVANATLVVSAARGECWVEVRAGSATGRPLYAGLLEAGGTLRFVRPKLWIRLGAPENVDLVLNGRRSPIPAGTAELTLPA